MNTMLPYKNFQSCAVCLDDIRLGKQICDCTKIMRILMNKHDSLRRERVCVMWEEYPQTLAAYAKAMNDEFVRRIKVKNQSRKLKGQDLLPEDNHYSYQILLEMAPDCIGNEPTPWWLGEDHFHEMYRRNLLRMNEQHFVRYFGNITPACGYYWPDDKYRRTFELVEDPTYKFNKKHGAEGSPAQKSQERRIEKNLTSTKPKNIGPNKRTLAAEERKKRGDDFLSEIGFT